MYIHVRIKKKNAIKTTLFCSLAVYMGNDMWSIANITSETITFSCDLSWLFSTRFSYLFFFSYPPQNFNLGAFLIIRNYTSWFLQLKTEKQQLLTSIIQFY